MPTVPYSGRVTRFVNLSVLAECHLDIPLTRTSEEGLPLFNEEVVFEYFSLLLFVVGHRWQGQEGFLLQGIILVLRNYLGIYGLTLQEA